MFYSAECFFQRIYCMYTAYIFSPPTHPQIIDVFIIVHVFSDDDVV